MLGLTSFKSIEEFGDLIRHPGEVFVFVIEGKVAVHTEHYEPVGFCGYLMPSVRMSLSSAFRKPVGFDKHAK